MTTYYELLKKQAVGYLEIIMEAIAQHDVLPYFET